MNQTVCRGFWCRRSDNCNGCGCSCGCQTAVPFNNGCSVNSACNTCSCCQRQVNTPITYGSDDSCGCGCEYSHHHHCR